MGVGDMGDSLVDADPGEILRPLASVEDMVDPERGKAERIGRRRDKTANIGRSGNGLPREHRSAAGLANGGKRPGISVAMFRCCHVPVLGPGTHLPRTPGDGWTAMLLINFVGSPGSGKSTAAAGLFHRLKTRHWNVELVTEYTKELILMEDRWSLSDELLYLG